MKALLARWQASRLGRTWSRYGERRGPVLAGGVAYAALFSVFGALVAGFSLFGLVLGGNQMLFDSVVESVDATIPGLLDVGPDGGPVDPAALVDSDLISVAGAIAFATALFAGLGWLGALREGLRAVLGLSPDGANPVVKKLTDVLVLALVGVGILSAAATSLVVGAAASALLRSVGLEGGPIGSGLLRLLALVVVALVDASILWVLIRVLLGLRLPWSMVRGPVLAGGAALAVVANLGGLLAGRAGGANPLLATGAVLVGLLVLLNLLTRIMLLSVTWISTGPAEPLLEADGRPLERRSDVDLVKHPVARRPVPPAYSRRAGDRTTIAAGVVLGAVGVSALRVAAQGAARLWKGVRGR